jgi:hypothetical protein
VNGILQRFIEPKTTHNEVIRAIWSPKLCLLERAENKHALHDNRYGLFERTVVYEGPEYYYTSEPLRGPVLSGQIQKICEAVIAHIGEVTYGQKQISRIVLNFKVDSRDKIWFLYSTSIRSMDMLEYNPLSGGETVRRSLVNIDSVVSLADSVHLNPIKTYEKIVPKSLITCLSCAKETLEDARHPITYKQIMKHYEHVLLILQSSSSAFHGNKKEGTVIWPPDAEVLQATGNVGFGCMQLDHHEEFRVNTPSSHHHQHHSHSHTGSHSAPSIGNGYRRTMTLKHKKLRDVSIPPILSYLHTKLSPDTFERCKTDPLFQNKTVLVCEDCYLVYAEFATMMLRMGENLKKLLLPNARQLDAASSLMSGTSTTAGSQHNKRPSSADWRAISSAALSSSSHGAHENDRLYGASRGGGTRSRREREAKERAIGLRTSDARQQPTLPTMVRSASESASITHAGETSMGSLPTMMFMHSASASDQSMRRHSPMPFRGGRLEQESLLSTSHLPQQQNQQQELFASEPSPSTFSYDTQAVHTLIAEREKQFFKEISLNPQLRDHHPLQHLLHAQQKLKLVDEQSGVLMNKSAAQSESIFGTRYGRQAKDQHERYGMYQAEVPYALHGEIILPSQLKIRNQQKMRAKKQKKQEALQHFLEQQRQEEEAQMEALHRQMLEREAVEKALGSSKQQTKKGGKAGAATVDPTVVSSLQYRDFLKESLQKIGGDMNTAQAESQSPAMQQARQELFAQQQQELPTRGGTGASTRSNMTHGNNANAYTSSSGAVKDAPIMSSNSSVTSTTSSISQQSLVSKMGTRTSSTVSNSSQRKSVGSIAPAHVAGGALVSSSPSAKLQKNVKSSASTTSKTAPTEVGAQLPSSKSVNTQQVNYELVDRINDNNSLDRKKSFEQQLSTTVSSEQLAAEEQVSPLLIQKLDPQAPLWSISGGVVPPVITHDPSTHMDTTIAQVPEDEDGISLTGSLNLPSAAAVVAVETREYVATTSDDDSYTREIVDSMGEGRLVPGGQQEDREDGREGDDDGLYGTKFAAEHNTLDQMSIGQSSLGQSIVDLDAIEQLNHQFADNSSENNNSYSNNTSRLLQHDSIASLTAEGSITSADSSMRQQTDALLQLSASSNSQEHLSGYNGGNSSLTYDDKQQDDKEVMPSEQLPEKDTSVQDEKQPQEEQEYEQQLVAGTSDKVEESEQNPREEEIHQQTETNLD